jgi:hypothetical protein
MSEPADPLTITRDELYELVWSKPMMELAKDFGLSDVAVAKRCRKLGVPVPGRGYWARVAAGQTPRQPKLKARNEQAPDHGALTFAAPKDEIPEDNRVPASPEHVALRERIVALPQPVVVDLARASPSIKRTAIHLRRKWRKDIVWERGERRGPIAQIKVSDLVADRALRVAEQLISAAKALGWPYQPRPQPEQERDRWRHYSQDRTPRLPQYGCLMVLNEPLGFRIEERNRQVDHVPTADEKQRQRQFSWARPPRWDLIPSGELRLHLVHVDSSRAQRTWQGTVRSKLENSTNKILLGFLDEALAQKRTREEHRRQQIKQRQESERRWQLSQRRSRNAKLLRELEAQAGAWLRARVLRSYLRALTRSAGSKKLEIQIDDNWCDFIDWAHRYVAQVDPLSDVPHDPDHMDENLERIGSRDDGIQQSLSRLLGRHWQESFKVRVSQPVHHECEIDRD